MTTTRKLKSKKKKTHHTEIGEIVICVIPSQKVNYESILGWLNTLLTSNIT